MSAHIPAAHHDIRQDTGEKKTHEAEGLLVVDVEYVDVAHAQLLESRLEGYRRRLDAVQ